MGFGNLARVLTVILVAAGMCACDKETPIEQTDSPYALRLTLSTNRIFIGQVLSAVVEVLHPGGAKPVFTDPGGDGHVIVRDRSWDNRVLEDNREITTIHYKLTSFELGEHRLFDGKLTLRNGDKLLGELKFEDCLLSVESALTGGNEELRDISECRNFAPVFPRWILVMLLIATGAAILGAVVARILSKRHTFIRETPRPAAHKVALRDLCRLREKGWIESGEVEAFYVELSRIVRQYIEDRFDLHAPEQTTEEFIRETSVSTILPGEHRELTAEFLRQSDMVKFARFAPSEESMVEAFNAGERLVKETQRTDDQGCVKEEVLKQ
jgi:hypothetical protein